MVYLIILSKNNFAAQIYTDLNITKLHINNSTFDNLNIIANLSNDINSLILKNIEILNNIYISKIHNNSIVYKTVSIQEMNELVHYIGAD